MTKAAIQARPKAYAAGHAAKQRGERFSPPDFRTDAAAYEAYVAGYRDAEVEASRATSVVDLKQLTFFVLCRSTYPFFETIAGFDCQPAAESYAKQCREVHPQFEYKVQELK